MKRIEKVCLNMQSHFILFCFFKTPKKQQHIFMKIKILFINLVYLLCLPTLYAQVTIGYNSPPDKGSLLEIKENGNSGKQANSKKGIGLPRVALSAPTILTIDDESKKNDYVGLMVYNTTDNSLIKPGTYCWTGSTWEQTIMVDTNGVKNSILQSNGDGTYDWSSASVPTYSFHRPTQISTFDTNKRKSFTYSYKNMVKYEVNNTSKIYRPENDLFKNNFSYTENLKIISAAGNPKYILLEVGVQITTKTNDGIVIHKDFWQKIKLEILLDDEVVKTYERVFNTPVTGSSVINTNLFSVIPLTGKNAGNYVFKIRISNVENTFKANEGTAGGYFNPSRTDFFITSLTDLAFILYEFD